MRTFNPAALWNPCWPPAFQLGLGLPCIKRGASPFPRPSYPNRKQPGIAVHTLAVTQEQVSQVIETSAAEGVSCWETGMLRQLHAQGSQMQSPKEGTPRLGSHGNFETPTLAFTASHVWEAVESSQYVSLPPPPFRTIPPYQTSKKPPITFLPQSMPLLFGTVQQPHPTQW